jgi:nicotinate-nucleotide adenylyltransferase
MKTGIFGGSFNPIHNGHIHLAKAAQKKLSLDRIILVPSGIAPHKSDAEYVDAEHRFNMCALAVSDEDKFEVSRFEIDRNTKSYSIYTVNHFVEIFPDDDFYLIIGSDMFLTFDKWFRYDEILSKVSLAVAAREEDIMSQLEEKKNFFGENSRICILNDLPLPMSSTKIRDIIKNNEDMSCYLSKNVVQYILGNNLYK